MADFLDDIDPSTLIYVRAPLIPARFPALRSHIRRAATLPGAPGSPWRSPPNLLKTAWTDWLASAGRSRRDCRRDRCHARRPLPGAVPLLHADVRHEPSYVVTQARKRVILRKGSWRCLTLVDRLLSR